MDHLYNERLGINTPTSYFDAYSRFNKESIVLNVYTLTFQDCSSYIKKILFIIRKFRDSLLFFIIFKLQHFQGLHMDTAHLMKLFTSVSHSFHQLKLLPMRNLEISFCMLTMVLVYLASWIQPVMLDIVQKAQHLDISLFLMNSLKVHIIWLLNLALWSRKKIFIIS